ncbi:MAG TPA: tRNA (adenosine(37)-N6)-threonylcarbamoyltransferase complex transferase subunit TsaD [Acidimicrobiales bacterium]|jgi:N6-L-threonylcarbamoyladenine synthase|nr:tRNA (adenosine(37)-N6)-threonylcarbamoyltransferase complex transferase subunit TsaD [Acidimicrobiales bacterium]
MVSAVLPPVGDTQRILGIETSCDETAAAVVAGGASVLSSVISSQVDLHARFGGVVPEIASRAHVELLTPAVAQALVEAGLEGEDIHAVAATVGPGLASALLVGVSVAKSLSLVWQVPFVGVNHMEGHLYACFLHEPDLELPLVALLVSGGHTLLVHMEDHGRYQVLGTTIDDAVGEAFDKVARFLGLGYPGGPAIDRLATTGDPEAVEFPRAMEREGYDFSFSGLKTAVTRYAQANPDVPVADLAASFQQAAVDVLVAKARRAVAQTGARTLCLGGGVGANTLLRLRVAEVCEEDGVAAVIPPPSLCTDNAAMVAAAAWWRLRADGPTPLDVGVQPNLRL